MATSKNAPTMRTPKLCHHKGQQLGYVNYKGKRHYFTGKWPTGVSVPSDIQSQYNHWVLDMLQREQSNCGDVTIGECLEKFLAHRKEPKMHKAVTSGDEILVNRQMRQIKNVLVDAFRSLLDEHPSQLTVVHLQNIRVYWTNTRKIKVRTMKAYWCFVRTFIVFCISRGLFPDTLQTAIDVLPRMNTAEYPNLIESGKREAVTIDQVRATLPFLNEMQRVMVQTQMATGMRPMELCGMTWDEIDTKPELWLYEPRQHKMSYKGKTRHVYLSADVQDALTRWQSMRPLPDSEYIFTPTESWILGRQKCHPNVPLENWLEAVKHHDRNPFVEPRHFHQAIKRACKSAGVEHWTPYQCRHFFAQHMMTVVTDLFAAGHAPGAAPLEAVGALLGHSNPQTTNMYTGENTALAKHLTAKAQNVVKLLLG